MPDVEYQQDDSPEWYVTYAQAGGGNTDPTHIVGVRMVNNTPWSWRMSVQSPTLPNGEVFAIVAPGESKELSGFRVPTASPSGNAAFGTGVVWWG